MTRQSVRASRARQLAGLLPVVVIASWVSAQPGRGTVELPPLRTQQAANTQLLANSDFEAPDTGWGLYEWPPREKTGDQLTGAFVTYSQDVVRSGKYALCFDFTQLTPDRLLAARQDLTREALAPFEGRMVRISAWVWVGKGPAYYQGSFGTRQWGEPGTPPLAWDIVPLGGPRGEWIRSAHEFRLKLGSTGRADFNIWLSNVPDTTKAPVVYVDDASLEVIADPPLGAELACGKVISKPDYKAPVPITVSEKSWLEGLRFLRWDVTSADGRRSYADGKLALAERQTVLEVALPNLAAGDYAIRLALGARAGERSHEVLLPIRRAEGPFGN